MGARVPSRGSVTRWIDQLKSGDPVAAQNLWERYFRRLLGVARKRLRTGGPRVADEEDVALSAFNSLFRGAKQGRFPRLDDRDDLWRLLVVLTVRKASKVVRDEGRQKRGPKPAMQSSATDDTPLDEVISREPTPEFALQIAEEWERLFALLDRSELRTVALWKMEGYTAEEIARKLDCTPRTVFRKLDIIRGLWEKSGAS